MSNTEITPCPFCGASGEMRPDPGVCDVPFGFVVEHTSGCFFSLVLPDDSEMIAAWNTRAVNNHDALVDALNKCRAIIKFHVDPSKCVRMGGEVCSAQAAYEEAVAALANATGEAS